MLSEKPFWSVGSRRFYNKLSAIAESERLHLPVTFYLFEDTFDRWDWTREPTSSWEDLLRQRALQIRDNYSYIRLWYSGGADSHTILLTFLKNQIPIDEIAMIRRSPINLFDQGLANCEINDAALPFLKLHEHQLRKTKITLIDLGRPVFERAFIPDVNWLYQINNLSFLPDNSTIFSQNIDGILDKSHSLPSYCDIDGYEKPKLVKKDGKFYSFMWDGTLQRGMGINDHQVQFFLSAEFPELHIKQCHLVKNYLQKTYPNIENIDPFFDISNPKYVEMTFTCRYPLWNDISSLRLGKSKSLYSAKTNELLGLAQKHLPKLHQSYFANLKAENNLYSHRYNNGDITHELKGISSKHYCLE